MIIRTKHRRGPHICCFAILLLIVALIILYFAVLKPKQPEVHAAVVGIRSIQFQPFPNLALNITLDVDVTVENPNYAGFEVESGTTLVYYRGSLVGQAPVMEGEIDARSTETIRMTVDLDVSRMASNPSFVQDIASRTLPLESSTTVEGKVTLLGIFKLHASAFASCEIVVSLLTNYASTNCNFEVR